MRSRLWLVGFGVACLVAAAANADGPSDELKKFEATWLVDSATRDGKPAADWKDAQLEFAGDKMTLKGPKGEQKHIYKVDPSKKPKAIDFAFAKKDPSEAPQLGIYELDGDTLKLCIGPVDKRPTEFSDKKGLLAVLKRKKKEPSPRSLADEAAFLSEKSGKAGWVAEEVALTHDGGKEKHTGQLSIAFKARKGEPSGLVTLRWRAGKMNGAVGDMGFDLVEKDGKRFVHVKDATGREVVLRLEYSIEKDVLTIKGAVSKAWTAIFDDQPNKAVAFKPSK